MVPKDQSTLSSSSSSKSLVQFFIRDFSGSSLVFVANLKDTVLEIHNRITSMTGIPITEQRFIFRGKQLQCDQTLDECGLVSDSTLQLVGRMKSFDHLPARQILKAMVGLINYIVCESGLDFDISSYIVSYGLEKVSNDKVIKAFITRFFSMAKKSICHLECHLEIFMTSLAPRALVSLYNSVFSANRKIAKEAIQYFVYCFRTKLPKDTHRYCTPILLEFCKLLGDSVGTNDSLYIFCRRCLMFMVNIYFYDGDYFSVSFFCDGDYTGVKELIDVRDIFRFINELAGKLSHGLVLSMGSAPFTGVSSDDVGDFAGFLDGLRINLAGKNDKESYKQIHYEEQMELLHGVFKDLLGKMEMCLEKMEFHLDKDEKENLEQMSSRWNQYLAILKELNTISKMLEGAEELFWRTLGLRRVSFRYLIVRFAKFSDRNWILVRKEVTNFETRRHLIMMMFPDVKDEYDELYEMLIDRSKLLEESFEYIRNAEVESLHGGILVEFKNEKAAGPGVLREWFFLVCREIFNPQNALFVACPNDRRRFFPTLVSKVDPLHLEYFSFCGRIIALALMHKIQIGIVFDRVFFVQLAGKDVYLEDICDADPYLYNSCKKILEMDADMVDQDVLGLTFVREVFELGTRKIVELCYGGKSISVTSRNREVYVHLLVQHSFVKPIAEQMNHFTRGFADIMDSDNTESRERLKQIFFKSIDLEELDWMLHGSECSLSVKDWMAHTKYVDFKETDPQIRWFWKIVGEMSGEQRRGLLFFWTSIKYLPVEGFRGLASRLSISRSFESTDRLPFSHTCFYSLIFPPYPSEKVMQDRLDIITQEHVGFGAT